jgi:hypothetical protein
VRRKRNLYHYVYPEYVLLNSEILRSGSGASLGQERLSLTEIEAEFKRELGHSSREYTRLVQKFEQEKCKASQQESRATEQVLDQKTTSKGNSDICQGNITIWAFTQEAVF